VFTLVQFECGETTTVTTTFGPFVFEEDALKHAEKLFPGLEKDEYGRGVTEDGDHVYQVASLKLPS
jgi:hypothetical protein